MQYLGTLNSDAESAVWAWKTLIQAFVSLTESVSPFYLELSGEQRLLVVQTQFCLNGEQHASSCILLALP